jgi:hypothetical protein
MQIYITQQSASVMESSSTLLSGDDIERILEETLLDSESSLYDSGDDSSAIEGLKTHEASGSAGNSTSPLQDGASDMSFMWEDMSKVKSISFI